MIYRVAEFRNEIARSIKSVRVSCFGRKCLKECVRRMAATAPCPRATRRRWGAAVAAVLLFLGACGLEGADVQCIWNGNTYVCSGTGSSIEVIGGGSGEPVTVTNFWGVCTNCVSMSPSDCEALKARITSEMSIVALSLSSSLGDVQAVLDDLEEKRAEISTFRRFGSDTILGNGVGFSAMFATITSYVYTVDNTQTDLVRRYMGNNVPSSINHRYGILGYTNGIYDYAHSIAPALDAYSYRLNTSAQQLNESKTRLESLSTHVHENLVCEECQPDYKPGGSPGGGGSGSVTNGNWCTFDQGEAIKDLLRDLNNWAERQHSQLVAISNFTENCWNTMREGLFTGYDHIPTEEELGVQWEELYLKGYSPNFHEYASTNILARIELLLAGMSGVLTNSSDFAEAGQFAQDGIANSNKLEPAVKNFTNEVADVIEQRERNVRSVGNSLIGLYNAFRGWSGTPFSRTTLINSYSVEIGENHWDVPSFEPSEKGLWVGNLIRVVCRSVMSVLYILFTVAVFVRFHIAFFQWVFKYLKWGIELMQGLFA